MIFAVLIELELQLISESQLVWREKEADLRTGGWRAFWLPPALGKESREYDAWNLKTETVEDSVQCGFNDPIYLRAKQNAACLL